MARGISDLWNLREKGRRGCFRGGGGEGSPAWEAAAEFQGGKKRLKVRLWECLQTKLKESRCVCNPWDHRALKRRIG